jgi:outer membrane protein OmpA-like peptidoglycan-associated protein
VATGVALADPPNGYRCGDGKPSPGKGCTCPAGFVDKRDGENNAICAPGEHAPHESPCAKLATRFGALSSKRGAARERWVVLDSCAHDHWSAEATHCEREADAAAIEACLKGKLTGDQVHAFDAARDALFERIENEVDVSAKQIGKRFALFAGRSAKLDDMAEIWISAVADKLFAHPEIQLLEVQSHVDNGGGEAASDKLTQQRAELVRDELVKLGVDRGRLAAKGYGWHEPDVPNDTEAHRTLNRRELFVIQKRAEPKKKDPPPSGGPGTIRVTTDTRGSVLYLDDKQTGVFAGPGSLDVDATAGKHRIRIEAKDGRKQEREVDVVSGKTVAIKLVLGMPR